MKSNKSKAKKGMTLIEVIISVALLSILLIPISGLVMSSFKNNKKSEYKQQASYIGQKVLEELKAYDSIDASKGYFELLDGDKIVKDTTGNTFIGNFKRNIYGITSETESGNEVVYNVKVTMTEDGSFKYSDMNNLNKNNDAGFKLDFINDNNTSKIQISSDSIKSDYAISNDLIIELDKDSNNLRVFNRNDSNPIIKLTKSSTNNKVILYVKENYIQSTNIEIKNNTNEFLDIYLIKQNNGTGKLNLISSNGNVILYEEDEIDTNPVGDMYNYTVTVTDDDKNILFEGSSSKNIKIK